MEKEIEQRQIKPDLEITHQGQCAHQVSLNLADPDFPGLTRFLSQGLLNGQIWKKRYESSWHNHSLALNIIKKQA